MGRPNSITESVPGLWRLLRYFWPWIRRERGLIAGSVTALVAGVLLQLAEPWPLKFVLDRLIPSDRGPSLGPAAALDRLAPTTLLALCAACVVALSGLRALADYHQRIGLAKIGLRVLRRVRDDVYQHVQSLSLSFHHRTRSGDLIVRVTRDVSLLRDVTSTAMLPLVANTLVLSGVACVMLLMEWRLALLALTVAPLFVLSTMRLGRGIQRAARKQRAREGEMAATAAESITAIREVQALSLGETFAASFANRNVQSQKEDLKATRLSAQLGRTVDLLLALATALVLWYGGHLALRGSLSPGDLLVFLTYLRRAFHPVRDFAKHTERLAKATAAGERVMALLDEAPEIRDLPGAADAGRLQGAIRFDQVDFEYLPGRPALAGIDFEVPPGQIVALTGPSGSGKSTLISLLLRLYDPVSGRLLIDGQDVRTFTLGSLRSQVSVVLQDSILFATTIRDNIACGRTDATDEEIERAARLARVDEFVARLPQGYETMVGERGVTLSLGQRQRIAIARAALRRAPILVLDEPTTGLDERNERAVSAAILELARNSTTILASHDTRLTRLADFVLYLEHGRVVERGSPAALIAAGGRYAELFEQQTGWSRGSEREAGLA